MKKIIISVVSIFVLCILVLVVNFIVVEKNGAEISKGKPIVQKEMRKQALLVIDIQEGITGRSSTNDYFMKASEGLISIANQVIDSSAGNGVPVVYVKNEISNPLINILNSSMAKGSPGAELDSRLKVVSDYIVNKDKSDAFSNPLLDSILVRNEINTLAFVGLDLAACVNSTVMAAVNRNYRICLIEDALITNPDSLKQSILEKFKHSGFEVISSKEYFKSLHR